MKEVAGFEILPVPFRGVLRISTTAASGISLIGLRGRYNERADFLISTAEPVNEAEATGTEIYFPHFVQSGGYTTQFVLFPASANAASGTLPFFTQYGQPFNLTVR